MKFFIWLKPVFPTITISKQHFYWTIELFKNRKWYEVFTENTFYRKGEMQLSSISSWDFFHVLFVSIMGGDKIRNLEVWSRKRHVAEPRFMFWNMSIKCNSESGYGLTSCNIINKCHCQHTSYNNPIIDNDTQCYEWDTAHTY